MSDDNRCLYHAGRMKPCELCASKQPSDEAVIRTLFPTIDQTATGMQMAKLRILQMRAVKARAIADIPTK